MDCIFVCWYFLVSDVFVKLVSIVIPWLVTIENGIVSRMIYI